jgi:hypothetical protein
MEEAGETARAKMWERKRIPAVYAGEHGGPVSGVRGRSLYQTSGRTDCTAGKVSLEGTPCIGRARDLNGGRVGRSGTKEDIRPQVGR